jgi:hypothetical protein
VNTKRSTCRDVPDLLRWLTSYAPKTATKLKVAQKEDGVFYDREELLSFDAFLRQPWPASLVSDPVPTKIERSSRPTVRDLLEHGTNARRPSRARGEDPEITRKARHGVPANARAGHYGPSADADFVGDHKRILRKFRVMGVKAQRHAVRC